MTWTSDSSTCGSMRQTQATLTWDSDCGPWVNDTAVRPYTVPPRRSGLHFEAYFSVWGVPQLEVCSHDICEGTCHREEIEEDKVGLHTPSMRTSGAWLNRWIGTCHGAGRWVRTKNSASAHDQHTECLLQSPKWSLWTSALTDNQCTRRPRASNVLVSSKELHFSQPFCSCIMQGHVSC